MVRVKNTEKAPIYFDLYGGGFFLGSADMDEMMNLGLNKQVGCKIISIDYAKAPEFPYPVAINQVYAVVKHVFANAEKYAVDSNKMAIGGHSSVGNLSTVTYLEAKKEGKFQFVCQIYSLFMKKLAANCATSPIARLESKSMANQRLK